MRTKLVDLLHLVRDVPGGPRIFLRPEYDRFGGRLLAVAGWHRRHRLARTRIVAVVGSLGKTTATAALRATLACPERGFSYSNYGASLAENLLRVRPRDAHAVLEVGVSRPGPMAGYARRILPDVVVVTSIASDHNRSFPTLLDTREEKVKMIRGLAPESVVLLNGDDPNVRWMASQTRARVVTFGFGPENDVRALDIRPREGGSEFEIHGLGEICSVRTQFRGAHMAYPALAALTVASNEGIEMDVAIDRLAGVAPSTSRLETIEVGNGVTLIDDSSKASLETVLSALDAFDGMRAERKVVVLGPVESPSGPGGECHREVGRRVGRFADLVVCIGHRMTAVRAGAVESGMSQQAVHLVGPHLDRALEVLREVLRPGDAVLIKGRAPQRLRRLVLQLQGRAVGCAVAHCGVKVPSCDVCPLLDASARVFDNAFVARSVRAQSS
jgi:UDP-N-acetylmuramoyl-tripeptide--D-alanyl-D-alanine ligase